MSLCELYRRICQIAKDTGNSAPSYDVIYEVRQVPADLLTLAHEGKKTYLQRRFRLGAPPGGRATQCDLATDHTLLDILVQRESENPAQPWPRVILDDYSRAVAGLFLFFEAPSAAQTALALRQALSRSGCCLISPWRHSKGAACAL